MLPEIATFSLQLVLSMFKWTPLYCDDGTLLMDRSEKINWACQIDGCSVKEEICWTERLDCSIKDETCSTEAIGDCDSVASCALLWFGCANEEGAYVCLEPATIGCNYGECLQSP